MMSVLHILPSLALGGAERVTLELAALQRRKGLDAAVLSLGSPDDFLVAAVRDSGIPVQVCPAVENRWRRYARIRRLASQYDVLHIHSPRGLRYLTPVLLSLSHKTIVYTRHGLDPLNSPKWKLIHRLLRSHIDYVTFVTDAAAEVFRQNHAWPAEKLAVITNGVAVSDKSRGVPRHPIRLGSVGRMVGLKGQPILLDAIAQLEQAYGAAAASRFTLNFFGAGPLEIQLQQQAAPRAPGLVTFRGEVRDLEAIYAEIDLLVVASESEGLSMVIIEAMARGIPAVATAVGGNPTLVRDGETGRLVPYGSAEALAAAIDEAIKDPDRLAVWGEAAQALIRRQFSLDETHARYLACYERRLQR